MTSQSQPAAAVRQAATAPEPGSFLPRWWLVVLAAWSAVWFAILAPAGGIAWKPFFNVGGALLLTGHYGLGSRPGGLDIYASYPQLQIGPLALGAAGLLRLLGPDDGLVTAQIAMTLLGLLAVLLLVSIARAARPGLAGVPGGRITVIAGAAIFVPAWQELAVGYGHLDDALALVLAAAALRVALAGLPVLAGAAVGLAADAKPWALIFLPVLLLSGGLGRRQGAGGLGRRQGAGGLGRRQGAGHAASPPRSSARHIAVAAASAAGAILAAWLPFFAAEPGSTAAFRYKILNVPDSALRALGVAAHATPPWDRPAQIILGCALGTAAIARGRWPAVILLAVGARIALDPGVHGYYTPGVLLGALIWDLAGTRRPLPLWTATSFCALNLVPLVTASGPGRGAVRLWIVLAWTLVILLAPARWIQPPGAAGASATPTVPGPV